ncbi:MAG TPA: SAM-dependent chlorinase/fluorinase [Thermoanaerobaculia bacterium]|nr:SAM-dependent chlorinase/fluorinase [Thermoanaerobaculia bacterium]
MLTDFGTADYYVAAVKGVLLRLAPGATVVDVSHEVAAGDVEGGAWLLGAAWRWFPEGTVHLAVVDPGVGSERRILAARVGGHAFVAPDNGLLTPVLGREGAEVRAVERSELFLPGPGATFHGRDRFAPVAAYLARGEELAGLGPAVEDAVRLALPVSRSEGEPPRPDAAGAVLRGRVMHVDRFGNLVTDVPGEWLGDGPLRVEVGGHATELRVTHYGEIPEGDAAALIGSLGTLELSARDESLAQRWRVARGATVAVELSAKRARGG